MSDNPPMADAPGSVSDLASSVPTGLDAPQQSGLFIRSLRRRGRAAAADGSLVAQSTLPHGHSVIYLPDGTLAKILAQQSTPTLYSKLRPPSFQYPCTHFPKSVTRNLTNPIAKLIPNILSPAVSERTLHSL